jgi:glutathione-regulated potassium-efflux system ancillary protein KefG
MKKILILFAHPAFEKSRAHKVLIKHLNQLEGVTFNDLYENYPEFDIDVEREQELLLTHDIIVWQHPLYWYSGPALLKQWMDLVLLHGWAYGKDGHALDGKRIFNAFSSGGGKNAYASSGVQGCTISEVLMSFQKTAELCRMIYLPPFWIPGTHRMESSQLNEYGKQYRQLLVALRDDQYRPEEIRPVICLNDLLNNN